MTSRDRTLISGLKQLFVVAARVATVNTTVAEVSSGQKQDTTNDNIFTRGLCMKLLVLGSSLMTV